MLAQKDCSHGVRSNDPGHENSETGSPLQRNLGQRKIPSLDGMRAVAVTLVILFHQQVPFIPEGRGVLTFFVMSGFLITWFMLKESEQSGGMSIRDFYARRALRILPAFYVFWLLYVSLALLLRGAPSAADGGAYASAFFFFSNYWHATHASITMVHTWALSMEEQFYLLWPWVFVAFQHDLRKLTRIIVGVIVTVDVYRIILFFGWHASEKWLTYAFDCRIDHLMVGCLLAVILKRGTLQRFWDFATSRPWFSVVTLALIVASIALNFRFHVPYRFAVAFVADPILTAVFLVQVIAFSRSALWGWLNSRIACHIGKVSYSMFLFHTLTNELVRHFLGRHSALLKVPVSLVLAVTVGSISFFAVEKKFLRMKSRTTAAHARKLAPATSPLHEPA